MGTSSAVRLVMSPILVQSYLEMKPDHKTVLGGSISPCTNNSLQRSGNDRLAIENYKIVRLIFKTIFELFPPFIKSENQNTKSSGL